MTSVRTHVSLLSEVTNPVTDQKNNLMIVKDILLEIEKKLYSIEKIAAKLLKEQKITTIVNKVSDILKDLKKKSIIT